MRPLTKMLGATTIALSFAVLAGAAEAEKPQATAPATAFTNQTHCPVMGGKIDSTVFTDIQGQRVYHCCPMCSGKLKDDPDTYFEKAAEQRVVFENIQTACTVSGDSLQDKSITLVHDGRTLAFCSELCRDTFRSDPEAHMGKLIDSQSAKSDAKVKKSKKHDHSDHNH
jgi:YHS domain-containing protein